MAGLLDDIGQGPDMSLLKRPGAKEAILTLVHRMGVTDADAVLDRMLDGPETLGDVMKVTPDQVKALVQYATDLATKGNPDDAVVILGFVAMMAPLDMRPFYAMGTVMQIKGDLRSAAHNYLWGVTLDASFPHGWMRLGEVHMANKQFAEAREFFERGRAIAKGTPLEAKIRDHADRMLSLMPAG